MTAPRISISVASAGTGKTTRIVTEIARLVVDLPPESLLATTFTIKAADEIVERARARLFADGQADLASGLLAAPFGTVNAVSGRIATQFAVDLGRSPSLSVIPEANVARRFAAASSEAIDRHAPTLNRLADRFGASDPRRPQDGDRADWRRTTRLIVDAARSNGLRPDDLAASAARSIAGFLALLPPSADSAEALDAALLVAVEQALALVPDPLSATARDSVATLRRAAAILRRGDDLFWTDWARLTKIKCAQKDGAGFSAAIDAVKAAAGVHVAHPRLAEDCRHFIETLFGCAAESFDAYQRHKAIRGLVDFTDQEMLALDVVRTPALAARLAEQISVAFVDEFQDSSPIQVALFTALADIVQTSRWVGDPKQAIYGFRNADAALTQAAFDGVRAATGEPPEILALSYRSRRGIIDFVNAAFTPAFAAMGLPAGEHAFAGTAREETGFTDPPLGVWWLDGTAASQHAALAAGVAAALSAPDRWPVGTRNGTRRLRGSDVAILCFSNADVTAVAAALHAAGIAASVERDGLLKTPHVELVLAAMRWTADPSDSLALAEMARFFDDDPQGDAWLTASAAEDRVAAFRALVPILETLEGLRGALLALTPADLVDAIVTLPQVIDRVESWSHPAERLGDLEALRGYARAYEDECAGDGGCATPSGLILALDGMAARRPRSLADDAVQVLTYHRAKGLEWPMVILTGLGREPAARLWEPAALAGGAIDWRTPLDARWIRFWPWPYGSQSKDVGLDARAAASKTGQRALADARAEAVRLLYVGCTRARDHLIFAPSVKAGTKWVDALGGEDDLPSVRLPQAAGGSIAAHGALFPAGVSAPVAIDRGEEAGRPLSFVSTMRRVVERAPLHRRPSSAAGDRRFEVVERVEIGGRLPLTGTVDMRVIGEAMHRLLACHDPAQSREALLAQASGILARWGAVGLAPADALAGCERLTAFLGKRWPEADWRREAPIAARIGDQLVKGAIDLLGTAGDDVVVIDHKSFPGSRDQWAARAEAYGAQLEAYAQALGAAGHSIISLWVHMPVVGQMMRIERVANPAG